MTTYSMLPSTGTHTSLNQGDSGMSVADISAVLIRHRRFIAISGLVCLICAGAYLYLHAPMYAAYAMVRLDPYRAGSLGVGDPNSSNAPNQSEVVHTEISLMKSHGVAIHVLNSLSPETYEEVTESDRGNYPLPASVTQLTAAQIDAIKTFELKIDVRLTDGTQIIMVGAADHDPHTAAQLANELVVAYQFQSEAARALAVKQLQASLTDQIQSITRSMDSAQEKLAAFQLEHRILGTADSSNTATDGLRALSDRLAAANADRIQKSAALKAAEGADPNTLASLYPNPRVSELLSQQGVLTTKRAEMTIKYDANYPALMALDKQLKSIDTELSANAQEVRDRLRHDFRAALSVENMLQQEYQQQTTEAYEVNRNQAGYAALLAEVSSDRELAQGLQRKVQQAVTDAEVSGVNVIPIDAAAVPTIPIGHSKGVVLGAALLIGLFAGSAVVLIRDSTSGELRESRQIEQASRLPVLAVLPRRRRKSVANTLVDDTAYRTLRDRLLLSDRVNTDHSLLMVGVSPEESASVCAVNLAISFAQAGRKTLVVDANFEAPSLHEHLDGMTGEGLSELLEGAKHIPYVATNEGDGLLFGLPAGCRTDRARGELASERFATYLGRWSRDFDEVLLIGPPLLASSESLLLADRADEVLLVVGQSTTGLDQLLKAREMLQQINATVVGMFVTGAKDGFGA
jgi:polysaccharide biosynthesis transport protein